MLKAIAVLILGSILAVASARDSLAASQTEKVIIGTVASISDAGIYIGIAKGFFKEVGLELEPGVFDSGSNQVALLAAGKIDVAGGTPAVGLFNAFAQGVNSRIVADKGTHTPGHGYIAFLVRKELSGQVKRVEDLKKLDKPRFAINATGGAGAEAQLKQLLKMAGLDIKQVDVKIVPYPQVPAALASSSLDVAPTIEPYQSDRAGDRHQTGLDRRLSPQRHRRRADVLGAVHQGAAGGGAQFYDRVSSRASLLPERL
jgi:ABC-type nitrate/sulfonate/bicarbonate transport system substrate-binding protein